MKSGNYHRSGARLFDTDYLYVGKLHVSDGAQLAPRIEPIVALRDRLLGLEQREGVPVRILDHADLPTPAVVATWSTVLSFGKS